MRCAQGFERKSAFDVVMALAALELALGPGVACAQQQRAVGYGGAAAVALQGARQLPGLVVAAPAPSLCRQNRKIQSL